MLGHIIDHVILMLVSACVCFSYGGASFVNLGMALDSMVFFSNIIVGDASVDRISYC